MLRGIKKVLVDIFNLFCKVVYGYIRWVLVVVITIMRAQVFCKNTLRTNIRWSQEVALLFTTWMTLLSITVSAEKNLHIGVEPPHDKFPVKVRNVMDALNRIITLPVGAFSTVYGVRTVLSTMDSRSPVIKQPSSLMHIMIPINGTAVTYLMVFSIMGLKKYRRTNDAGKLNREEEEEE